MSQKDTTHSCNDLLKYNFEGGGRKDPIFQFLPQSLFILLTKRLCMKFSNFPPAKVYSSKSSKYFAGRRWGWKKNSQTFHQSYCIQSHVMQTLSLNFLNFSFGKCLVIKLYITKCQTTIKIGQNEDGEEIFTYFTLVNVQLSNCYVLTSHAFSINGQKLGCKRNFPTCNQQISCH